MNKTNKYLNIALRCLIFAAFILNCACIASFVGGFKNMDVNGLSEDNIVERFLAVLTDFTGSFKLYTVTTIVLGITLVFSIITRYKTRIVSFVFKFLSLLLCFGLFIGGMSVATGFNTLSKYNDLVITASNKETLIASLTDNGVSADDVATIADNLTNKEALSSAILAYLFVPAVLFVLVITSIHCLVKRNDPNGISNGAAEDQGMG